MGWSRRLRQECPPTEGQWHQRRARDVTKGADPACYVTVRGGRPRRARPAPTIDCRRDFTPLERVGADPRRRRRPRRSTVQDAARRDTATTTRIRRHEREPRARPSEGSARGKPDRRTPRRRRVAFAAETDPPYQRRAGSSKTSRGPPQRVRRSRARPTRSCPTTRARRTPPARPRGARRTDGPSTPARRRARRRAARRATSGPRPARAASRRAKARRSAAAARGRARPLRRIFAQRHETLHGPLGKDEPWATKSLTPPSAARIARPTGTRSSSAWTSSRACWPNRSSIRTGDRSGWRSS